MTKLDKFYSKAMALDRHRHTLREDAPTSAYNAAWEETYSWLLKKQDNVYALPHDSVVKLKIDALKGVLDKTKATPEDTSEILASKVDTLVSELQAVAADEEPGEVKSFIDRTIEAFRDVSYNANSGAASELHGGGMSGGGMGGDEFGGEDEPGEEEGGDNLPADLGLEGEQPDGEVPKGEQPPGGEPAPPAAPEEENPQAARRRSMRR